MLYVRQSGGTRSPIMFLSDRYTTPSLCCRWGGKTRYIPLVTASDSFKVGNYECSYDAAYLPRIAVRYNGATYHVVNREKAVNGYLRPSSAVISATTYGSWITYQWVNDKRFSMYRTAYATVSVTGFSVSTAGAVYALSGLSAYGSSGYAEAEGEVYIGGEYASAAAVGTKSISVGATTSYRPPAGTAPAGGSHYIESIRLAVTLRHKDGISSSPLYITWSNLDLNYWE